MDGTAWAGIFTLIGTLAGVAFTIYKFRHTQRSVDANTTHDQLQEDFAAFRLEFAQEKTERRIEREKDQREIRYQAGIIRHLDDELNEVRALMTAAGITPPPRRPWPPYPGEWVEVPNVP